LEQTADEFGKMLFDVTKMAAEFLEFDPSTYEASVKECMSNSEHQQEWYEDEEQVRLDVDTEGNELLTRQRTKELIVEQKNMEWDMEKALGQDRKPKSRDEAQHMAHMARQEVIDKIYIKHGINFADFNRAMRGYDDLYDDEEIKAVDAYVMACRK